MGGQWPKRSRLVHSLSLLRWSNWSRDRRHRETAAWVCKQRLCHQSHEMCHAHYKIRLLAIAVSLLVTSLLVTAQSGNPTLNKNREGEHPPPFGKMLTRPRLSITMNNPTVVFLVQ